MSLDEELDRVVPVIERLSSDGLLVSVDTSKPQVALAAVDAGAVVVNDVTGLEDPKMREVCADTGCWRRGRCTCRALPGRCSAIPATTNVVQEVREYLLERVGANLASGIQKESIVDRSGDRVRQDLSAQHRTDGASGRVLRHRISRAGRHQPQGVPWGRSSSHFAVATTPHERDGATAATIALAVAAGVKILRVHNVPLAVDVALTAKAMVPKDDGKETNRT